MRECVCMGVCTRTRITVHLSTGVKGCTHQCVRRGWKRNWDSSSIPLPSPLRQGLSSLNTAGSQQALVPQVSDTLGTGVMGTHEKLGLLNGCLLHGI